MPTGSLTGLAQLRQVARTKKEKAYVIGAIPWDASITCTRLQSRLKARGVSSKVIDRQLIVE